MKRTQIVLVFVFLVLISLGFASAQATPQSPTVCCEKTKPTTQNPDGMFCQDVTSEQCNPSLRQVPTSCASTSYCKPGTCFDIGQGTCLDNTPQLNCGPGGIWKENPGPECNLGCCIIGDQAAFVTLTRCKNLSGTLGLETVFKSEIKDEVSCISSVLGQEKGACVFESEFQNTCKITTRADCSGGVSGTQTEGTFFTGKLCTADFSSLNLTVNCARQNKKACMPGKEEVYFIDTCGNPANIYDAAMVNEQSYWEDIKDKSDDDMCGINSVNGNAGSTTCGNCDYLSGSICRTDSNGANAKCTDLKCYDTSDGQATHNHGESWCVSADNSVGSRSYKHICINGEEVLEQCDDYRQQVCISGTITGTTFSQAACRVNRWQDCTSQSQGDCNNDDVRDCNWLNGKCVPDNPPGLAFWSGNDAAAICGQASKQCSFSAERKSGFLTIGRTDWHEESGEECADVSGSAGRMTISGVWKNQMNGICNAVGDCGAKTNWVGKSGTLGLDSMFSHNSIKED